jgi:hypothetical protein
VFAHVKYIRDGGVFQRGSLLASVELFRTGRPSADSALGTGDETFTARPADPRLKLSGSPTAFPAAISEPASITGVLPERRHHVDK